jgi:hypothetical protein
MSDFYYFDPAIWPFSIHVWMSDGLWKYIFLGTMIALTYVVSIWVDEFIKKRLKKKELLAEYKIINDI